MEKRISEEKAPVTAILKGLLLTSTQLFRNIFLGDKPTIQYPEEKRQYSERMRGVHILNKREDGSPKCVACYMCATICPAECITIEAGESPDKSVYKKEFLMNRPSLEKKEFGYRPQINTDRRGKGGKFLPSSYFPKLKGQG